MPSGSGPGDLVMRQLQATEGRIRRAMENQQDDNGHLADLEPLETKPLPIMADSEIEEEDEFEDFNEEDFDDEFDDDFEEEEDDFDYGEADLEEDVEETEGDIDPDLDPDEVPDVDFED